jgi:hypothetical protein
MSNLEDLACTVDSRPDIAFAGISRIEHLKRLSIAYSSADLNSTFQSLAILSELYEIEAIGANLGNKGLSNIAEFSLLSKMDLEDTLISREGLLQLAKRRDITELYLGGLDIVDSDIVELVANLVQLKSLALDRTKIDGACIESLAKLNKLQYLSLADTVLSDKAILTLGKSQFSSLKQLNLFGTQVSIRAVELFNLNNPSVELYM